MVGSVIVTDPSTNINTASSNYLIYPNPTSDFVYLSGFNGDSKTRVYNITGKLLQSTIEKKIDLSSYPNGLYIVNISSNNRVYTHTIIKG